LRSFCLLYGHLVDPSCVRDGERMAPRCFEELIGINGSLKRILEEKRPT
jgi:hypothetical protein